jgi:hypothetical protein
MIFLTHDRGNPVAKDWILRRNHTFFQCSGTFHNFRRRSRRVSVAKPGLQVPGGCDLSCPGVTDDDIARSACHQSVQTRLQTRAYRAVAGPIVESLMDLKTPAGESVPGSIIGH